MNELATLLSRPRTRMFVDGVDTLRLTNGNVIAVVYTPHLRPAWDGGESHWSIESGGEVGVYTFDALLRKLWPSKEVLVYVEPKKGGDVH